MSKRRIVPYGIAILTGLLLVCCFSVPLVTGGELFGYLECKYPYSFVWVYCSQSLFKSSPFQRAAFLDAMTQAINWWRHTPKIMPVCLSYQTSDIVFENGEDFVIWWQSQPVSRDMVIYIVDDYLQASKTECLNAIGNSDGTIFAGDASIWIATQHIRCANGYPNHQNWIPYSEFHDILKGLLGEAVGHSGHCPLGDILGPFWECIFESIEDAEHHPNNICSLCWRWYVNNALPLFNG